MAPGGYLNARALFVLAPLIFKCAALDGGYLIKVVFYQTIYGTTGLMYYGFCPPPYAPGWLSHTYPMSMDELNLFSEQNISNPGQGCIYSRKNTAVVKHQKWKIIDLKKLKKYNHRHWSMNETIETGGNRREGLLKDNDIFMFKCSLYDDFLRGKTKNVFSMRKKSVFPKSPKF